MPQNKVQFLLRFRFNEHAVVSVSCVFVYRCDGKMFWLLHSKNVGNQSTSIPRNRKKIAKSINERLFSMTEI